MSCRICTRCGKCGRISALPIREDGQAVLPDLVRRAGVGAAVDIGTTTVVTRLYDLADGRLLRQTSAFNPQREVAADVMGRVSAAMDGRLEELRDGIRETVWDAFGVLRPAEAVVVGNTTMLHLFAGIDPSSLATAPFAAERLFGESLSLRGVRIRLPRCAHAFFGADAVAAVSASGLCASSVCALLADVGTNGELALWRGDRRELTVTSVAAGPAFERSGVSGSEIVAAVANGLTSGAVDRTGLLTGSVEKGLSQADVRAVQMAKAAVFAGIGTLLAKTGTRVEDVSRFVIAGGFGSGLDLDKAAAIGLFPRTLMSVAEVCGNLAIEGAASDLFDPAFGERSDKIASQARHLELGGDDGFAKAFIGSMSF